MRRPLRSVWRNQTGNCGAGLGAGIEPTQLGAGLEKAAEGIEGTGISPQLGGLTRHTMGHSLKEDAEQKSRFGRQESDVWSGQD